LAGDIGDELEVGVVVEDRQSTRLRDGSDDSIDA
jgi:hypothetical protein